MIEIVNTAEIDVLWVLHDIWEGDGKRVSFPSEVHLHLHVFPIRGSLTLTCHLHDIWERRWEEGVLPIRGSLPKQASIKHVNSNNLMHII